MRMIVDLPLPLGPSNPKIEALGTWKLTSSTATRWPNRRVRCWVMMIGSVMGDNGESGGWGQAYRIQFWPSKVVPCGWANHRPKLNSVSLTPY